MSTATITRIDRSAIHDGPGVRTVIFLKGCPLRCAWCHSPETQTPEPELAFYDDRCIRCHTCFAACPDGAISERNGRVRVDRERCSVCGDCTTVCPALARQIVGHAIDANDAMRVIDRDLVFYEHSRGGVTISGGEPLQQPAFVEEVLRRCRARGFSTAVETCGMGSANTLLAIAQCTDLFLYDLKVMDDGRHRELTGGSNRQILENLRLLAGAGHRVRVRFPLVPGVTDHEHNVAALGALAAALHVTEVDVLPYHRAGLAKYQRLDRHPPDLNAGSRAAPIEQVRPPDAPRVESVIAMLRGYGLDVRTGGSR